MPSAFAIVSFAFVRGGRFGTLTLAINPSDAMNAKESSTKAALVPTQPATKPPSAAHSVSIADHVTDEIAFAGSNSLSETIEGTAAVLAGSKNAENASCK